MMFKGTRTFGTTNYAAERPLASNASAAGRARNRRVELVVLRRAAPEGGPTP